MPGAPSATSCCAKMRPAADDAVQAGKRWGEADGALAESSRRPVCAGRQGRMGGGPLTGVAAPDGGRSGLMKRAECGEEGRRFFVFAKITYMFASVIVLRFVYRID